jgi:hypothetical protein
MPRKTHPGTVAIIGGAGLLAWWLLRGKGSWLGLGGGAGEAGVRRPCRVQIRGDGVHLDGERQELDAMVTACGAAGVAEVTASGDAIVGVIASVLAALKDAGVVVYAEPDLWRLADAASQEPRNGSLSYRPIGGRGEPYPDWVRALKGRSGVYVIRERGVVVYVGESSANRLYETLTRHFQTWRRAKGFWKGGYAEGHDPGLTYDRTSVEVAVRMTSAEKALDEEARLIKRLKPRDNLVGQPELEEVPF